VPLLGFIGWRVTDVGIGRTVTETPLLETAMNQNGTQQASVFYLIADYTLGVAVWGSLPGTYTTGVHDRCHGLPIQFWLKRGTVTHLAPGTGTMRSEIALEPAGIAALRRALIKKGRGELGGTVRIYQGDVEVARAEHVMGVYADLPRAQDTRANAFQILNIKMSALMIAGLRGDAISERVAGERGLALASRMLSASPQLRTLVEARQKSIVSHLASNEGVYKQVLVLGVGLDPKPVLHSSDDQRWYGLDMHEMLDERSRVFQRIQPQAKNFVPIAADLRRSDWMERLEEKGFEATRPTLVLLEGVSMYLKPDDFCRLAGRIAGLLRHADSRFWLDHVTSTMLTLDLPETRSFFESMARLGEPFVNGFDSLSEASGGRYDVVQAESAADVLGVPDAIHREYRFTIGRVVAREFDWRTRSAFPG
jgi:hypothetical protein